MTIVTAAASYDVATGWTVADQDLSGLTDGTVTVSAMVEDAAGNSAAAVTDTLTLDTTADADNNFAVTVAASDEVTNLAESTNVSLSLSGIDADASSVSVEITDGVTIVTAAASYDVATGWTVADQDLSGLTDGTVTVSAMVEDAAGNFATVTDALTLDTEVVPPVTLLVR